MKINELQARQGNVELECDVIEVSPPREFSRPDSSGRVSKAKIQDDTGQITLTLWNNQIDQVQPGTRIKIHNGWVSEWQGELQLSTGKFGTLEVVDTTSKEHTSKSEVEHPPKPAITIPKPLFEEDHETESAIERPPAGGFEDIEEEDIGE